MQACTDLVNRAIDKPAEHVQVAGAGRGPIVIQWMRPEDETQTLESAASVLEIDAKGVIDDE